MRLIGTLLGTLTKTCTRNLRYIILCVGLVTVLLILRSNRRKEVETMAIKFKDIIVGRPMELCAVPSPYLTGKYNVSLAIRPFSEMEKSFTWLHTGGHQRPEDCIPRQKVAIIVPYRNRSDHLHIFLNNLHPYLRRQLYDTTIIVVEQAEPTKFNRAMLLNIGFVEAEKMGGFDCYILHDVDKIPENDRNTFNCSDLPRHMVIRDTYKYTLRYAGYIGGAISISKDRYKQINGLSNCYFGWGGEDDNMLVRLKKEKLKVWRFKNEINHYKDLRHGKDKGNEFNRNKGRLTRSWSKKYKLDGLNSLNYTVLSMENQLLFTRIYVAINKTKTKTCPGWS